MKRPVRSEVVDAVAAYVAQARHLDVTSRVRPTDAGAREQGLQELHRVETTLIKALAGDDTDALFRIGAQFSAAFGAGTDRAVTRADDDGTGL